VPRRSCIGIDMRGNREFMGYRSDWMDIQNRNGIYIEVHLIRSMDHPL